MSPDLLDSKDKEDLIEIVRLSNIIPLAEAQGLSREELIVKLKEKMADTNVPTPKRRGRPKKDIDVVVKDNPLPKTKETESVVAPKRRGRPKKSVEKAAEKAPKPKEIIKEIKVDEKPAEKPTESTKRRGRPKKGVEEAPKAQIPQETKVAEKPVESTKRRGRPKKGKKETPKEESPKEAVATKEAVNAPTETQGEPNKTKSGIALSEEVSTGILELMPDGYGFLRRENYLQGSNDIYVSHQLVKRFFLRPGDCLSGLTRLQRENDRYKALLYIKTINGLTPDKVGRRPHFDKLTPIYANDRFKLETTRDEYSTRIIDLIAPIGKGQRGMVVSPPKAGKTILLKKIANAISVNNPEVKLIVLLIDERPEEVTDMQRSINGDVAYSTFDRTPENHVKIAELVLARAMRLVEMGQDVVILLDSITRLARAYNLTISPTGRTLSGGLDPGALYGPKRFFGAARNIENGGSLTIVATSLVETGSRMDEVIFEEFKGTGNMEIFLDRKLSEKRIFPAVDINRSGTRREDLLLTQKELESVWSIRQAFAQLEGSNVTEMIINLMTKTQSNEQFVSSINLSLKNGANAKIKPL